MPILWQGNRIMKIFLAMGSGLSVGRLEALYEKFMQSKYLLQSYYYMKENQLPIIQNCKMFLLDSGAFTYMNSGSTTNIDTYLDKYINFINKYDIKYFFEMDTDVVHGLSKVEKMRYKLEKETGKKCIPVWHKQRGIQYYIDLCKNYDYIAIGGIVTKEIRPSEYIYFPKLLNTAKKYNCKVHGLGFTRTKLLNKYKFYSVDSTSWNSCFTYAKIFSYKNGEMKQVQYRDKRLKNYNIGGVQNLKEWIKYQNFADCYL